jgi:hypothetical protein
LTAIWTRSIFFRDFRPNHADCTVSLFLQPLAASKWCFASHVNASKTPYSPDRAYATIVNTSSHVDGWLVTTPGSQHPGLMLWHHVQFTAQELKPSSPGEDLQCIIHCHACWGMLVDAPVLNSIHATANAYMHTTTAAAQVYQQGQSRQRLHITAVVACYRLTQPPPPPPPIYLHTLLPAR